MRAGDGFGLPLDQFEHALSYEEVKWQINEWVGAALL